MTLRHILPIAALALLAAAGEASAHAHLLTSAPAAGATVAAPKQLSLGFSEKLEPKFSGLELTKADGAKVAVTAAVADKAITVTPSAPLAPGAYKVTWHAVAADGHKTNGDYGFTVK